MPSVLFVSKPVVPPFHDGAVCLTRDMALYLEDFSPTILTTFSAPPLGHGVRMDRIYARRGGFAPAVRDNLRVLAHVAFDRRHDLWHFVFAPTPKSSKAALALKRLRNKPTVQTIASRPLHFSQAPALLFGDAVIALSRHTADQLVAAGVCSDSLHIVPVPCADIARDQSAKKLARSLVDIPWDNPMLVYAGDLEFSSGARVMAEATEKILSSNPDVYVVFACRVKTPRAQQVEISLRRRLSFLDRVRWVGEVDDLPALIASATLMPFPVDNLYGKVDLPYVLLEAALLGVPTVAVRGGPLEEIPAVRLVEPGNPDALAAECVDLLSDPGAVEQLGAQARSIALERHDPSRVASQLGEIYRTVLPT